jgi:cell division septation protein DedD
MGIRDLFRKKRSAPRSKPMSRQNPPDEAQPKNGRLTLAVIASVLLMIPLAVLNVRLILDPSIAGKAFGTSVPSRPLPDSAPTTSPVCSVAGGKAGEVPPVVTFYSQLSAQEEGSRGPEHSGRVPIMERDLDPGTETTPTAGEHKMAGKKEACNPAERASSVPRLVAAPLPPETLPRPDGGTRVYMVQVGAFTHPRIAQQWAINWKSRGYDVMLKPVARPNAGVTYRLYLGKFESQKEADALVKRLKAKEGISAFRLLVRD